MTDRQARYETPERRHLKQIVFPNMEEAKAAADKLAQGHDASRRSPPSAGSRTATSISAPWRSRPWSIATSPTPPSRSRPARSARRCRAASAPPSSRSMQIEPGKTRPFEEVAAELKRDIAERARQERAHQRARQDRGRARRRRDARRRRAEVQAQAARHRGDRPLRQGRRTAIRCPTCRRASTCCRRPSAPTSASRTSRCGCRERRLCLVRRRGDHAGARPHARRGQGQVEARWRDDEIAARLKTKADRDARQAQGRHVVRRRGRGRQAQGRNGGRASSAATPPAELSPTAVDRDLPHAKDAAGSAEGAQPTERIVFRVTDDQRCRRSIRSRRGQAASTKRCAARYSRGPDRRNISRGCRTSSASPSIRAR